MVGIIVIVLICLAIAFGAYKLKKWNDEQDAYEQKRQEEAKKKAEFEAWQEKRKAIYKNHLPNIYGGLSRQELKQIYPLLQTMSSHDRTSIPGLDGFSRESLDIYSEAEEQLLILLNYPKWHTNDNEWNNQPIWIDIDKDYVYSLLYH